jgi:hypothetical protein
MNLVEGEQRDQARIPWKELEEPFHSYPKNRAIIEK